MKKIKRIFVTFLTVLILIGAILIPASANSNPSGPGWGAGPTVNFASPTALSDFKWRANAPAQGVQTRFCFAAVITPFRVEIGAQTGLMDAHGRDLRSSGIQRKSGTGSFSQFSNNVRSDNSTQIFFFSAGITRWQ